MSEEKVEYDSPDLLQGIAIDGEALGKDIESVHNPHNYLVLNNVMASVIPYYHHLIELQGTTFHIWSVNKNPSMMYIFFQLLRNSVLLRDLIDIELKDLGNNDKGF